MIIWLLFIYVLCQPTTFSSKHRKNLLFIRRYAYWLNWCICLKNGKREKSGKTMFESSRGKCRDITDRQIMKKVSTFNQLLSIGLRVISAILQCIDLWTNQLYKTKYLQKIFLSCSHQTNQTMGKQIFCIKKLNSIYIYEPIQNVESFCYQISSKQKYLCIKT